MYVSDKPNYPLVRTLLASLQRDLRWFLDPPDGSREHPATTCLELWLVNTSISNGNYYIDPNQGSPADAFQVFCDFTEEPKTCLKPLRSQFEYPGSEVVQMRFLRLSSRFCSQTVSYTCGPRGRQGPRERQPSEGRDSEERESVFLFESEDLGLLPLRDVGVLGNTLLARGFGFTVGPVCFS
ncbi:hypothetical protein CRUP_012403 [Coryphaenoides rupestris]|nr:hypothetical protein CRUP_012403 [Coryphaenoides rupestris]